MTDLVVRKIPWELDASVPFMWQPETFDEVVPFSDRGASTRELMSKGLMTRELKYRLPVLRARRKYGPPSIFGDVPSGQLAKMVWRLWLSQTPYHDPADQPLPDWADTWMREYDRGTDMTEFFGSVGPFGTPGR